MSTTNLFVELVVIGIFAAAWVTMALLACFGIPNLPWSQIPALVAAVPILAVVYVLDIITDRLADGLFEKVFVYRLRMDRFSGSEWRSLRDSDLKRLSQRADEKYRDLKLQILSGPDRIAELGEYARSRARICRGVAFNGAIAVIVMNVWMATAVPPSFGWADGLTANAGVLLIVVGAWYSWRSITISGLEKMEGQAKIAAQGR